MNVRIVHSQRDYFHANDSIIQYNKIQNGILSIFF